MAVQTSAQTAPWRTPVIVLIAGCIIAMVGFGVRSSLGLFLEPMTTHHGWDRQTFALAMALQNLLWGVATPFAGALADRYGTRWVLVSGASAYGIGIWGMAVSTDALTLNLMGGILSGIGVAFSSFSIAMVAMAKVVAPEKRSLALGLGTAAGSAGQVVFSPIGHGFISAFGWETALLLMAGFLVLIALFAFVLPTTTSAAGEEEIGQSLGEAFREAVVHRGYLLLTLGFFVCGFQIAFITVHFPAYVGDLGIGAHVGAYALALVGLFNIAGSFLAGMAGQRWSKKWSLALLYFVRSLAVIALLYAPKTEMTIYIFAATMGLFWLATVPLTSGMVAQIFGARYLTTLFGIVFLSHQLGSFMGVWLGGYVFDTTGSYDAVWWMCVIFGFISAVVHLPINENPLPRLARQTAT